MHGSAVVLILLAAALPASAQVAPPGGGGAITAHPLATFIAEFERICTKADGQPDQQEQAARSGSTPYLPARHPDGTTLPGAYHKNSVSVTISREGRAKCSVGGLALGGPTSDDLARALASALKLPPGQSGRQGGTPVNLWSEFAGPGTGTIIASAGAQGTAPPVSGVAIVLLPFRKIPS